MIYRTAPFSVTLNDPYPQIQGHAIFAVEYLINGTTYRHSFNEILIGTYTHPTQQWKGNKTPETESKLVLAIYVVTQTIQ